MSQDRKRQIASHLKSALKRYGVKYSLSVRNHSTIVMNIKSGPVDFFGALNMERVRSDVKPSDGISVNPYWWHEHFLPNTDAYNFLATAFHCLNEGNHDRSDIMTDYFDVGWYVDVNIGKWNKPYILTK